MNADTRWRMAEDALPITHYPLPIAWWLFRRR
jgi:hypothetical protein